MEPEFVDAGADEAPATITPVDLAEMFRAELDAEDAPKTAAKSAETVSETVAAPDDEAAQVEDEESEAEEADDAATAEPEDAADTPSVDPAIAAPSGMSDADKEQFGKLPSEMKAWVTKRIADQTADYTKKTQVIAEQKKHLDAGVQQIVTKLQALDQHLAKFTDHDIGPPDPALRNTDPVAYDEQLANYMHAQHVKELATKERQKVHEEAERVQKAQATKFFKEQDEILRTAAPELYAADGKMDTQKFKVIQEHAFKAGYSSEELQGASAKDIITLWKAQRFDAIEAAKKQVKTVPPPAPKTVKPGPAKGVGRPSAVTSAARNLEKAPSRDNLAALYLAELNSEKR